MNYSGKHDINYIISDLHLAEGNLGQGITLGTENFFSDLEFEALINHLLSGELNLNNSVNLIINGDFVDFIRVTEIPQSGTDDLARWQEQLNIAGINYQVSHNDIAPREKTYGLRTNDYKSIWKLYLCIKGHEILFQSLSRWVSEGNFLTIIVGNHDPEWYWPAVKSYFTNKLFEIAQECGYTEGNQELEFKKKINYCDKAYEAHHSILVEHGSHYDRLTSLCDQFELHLCRTKFFKAFIKKKPKTERESELSLPLGSFFNRYIINQVEIIFPFVDNITSNRALFRALIEEDVFNVLKLLGRYGYYTVRVVLKHFWKSLLEALIYTLITIVPFFLVIFFLNKVITSETFLNDLPTWQSTIAKVLLPILPILGRVLLKKLLVVFGFIPRPLPQEVFRDFRKGKRYEQYDTVFLGHNHQPEIKIENSKTYVNTGTWTSKYVLKYKHIQSGTKYAIGKILNNDHSAPKVSLLEWRPSDETLYPLPSFKNKLDE